MNVKLPVLAALAVFAGLLTGCDGDQPVTPPNMVATPSGAPTPGVIPRPDGADPSEPDPAKEPTTPGTATPNPAPVGNPGAAIGSAAPVPTTAPPQPDGSGDGMCLDPGSDLVASAIAGLEPTPYEGATWRIREVSEDPISQGCDDLLSYVAVEWEGIHPGVHILFFAEDHYLGTGSEEPYAYTTIIGKSRETVSVEYRWPLAEDPLCCPQGGPNLVVYYLTVDGELTVNGQFPPN